jgi:hypothetical protein
VHKSDNSTLHIISSPEPKAQGELLVSKGMLRRPSSVVMRQQLSSSLKLLRRFTSNLV